MVDRASADNALSVRIDGISQNVSVTSADLASAKSNLLSNINVVSNALSNEVSNRQSASAELQSAVNVVSNAVSIVSAAQLSTWNRVSAILTSSTTFSGSTYTFSGNIASDSVSAGTIVLGNNSGLGVGGNVYANAIYTSNYFYANGDPFTGGGGTATSNIVNVLYNNLGIAQTMVDYTSVSNTRAITYVVAAVDNVNSKYRTSKITVLHDGTTPPFVTEYDVVKSDVLAEVALFDADIVSGNIRLLATGDSANVTIQMQKVTLGSGTIAGTVGTLSQAQNLAALIDVKLSAPSDGDVLAYNASAMLWEARNISAEILGLSNSISAVSNALSVETVNRVSADNALSVRIDSISQNVSVTSADLASAKSNLLSAINVVSNALSIEIASRISAVDVVVSNALSAEVVNRTSAVAAETSNRVSADNALSVRIDGISNQVSVTSADLASAKSNLLSNINVVSNALSVELVNRASADNALSNSISIVSNALSNEISNRNSAVNVVSNALSNEISNRGSAVNVVSNALSVEIANRVSAGALKANLASPTFTGTVGGIAASMLTDVTIATPTNNQLLVYNSTTTKWTNTCLLYTSPSPRDS